MGSFVQSALLSGEKVEASASVSWPSQFIKLFVALVFLIAGFSGTKFCWVVTVLFVVWAFVSVSTTELAITNKKVIGKFGFFRRLTIDTPLTKVESVIVNQGIFGRMLGYGTIQIRGIGGTKDTVPNIAKPQDFRSLVMQILDS